jgi:hypothetical protein
MSGGRREGLARPTWQTSVAPTSAPFDGTGAESRIPQGTPDGSTLSTNEASPNNRSGLGWTTSCRRERRSVVPTAASDSRTQTTEVRAVRVTVSTSFVRAGADRLIGVWCIRRPAGREMEPQVEAPERSQPIRDSRRRVKKASNIGTRRVRSLDIGGHISVRPLS